MALTVEDGSGVSGADTYISLTDARAILTPLGQDLNATDATAEQQLRNAVYYLEAFRKQFKGSKVLQANPLQWPRYGVWIDGFSVSSDTIPDDLKRAQVYAAYEIEAGGTLQANSTGENVKMKEVAGAIKKEFFNSGAGASLKRFTRVDNQLSPLLNNSGPFELRSERG
jgi:hypothetical protein